MRHTLAFRMKNRETGAALLATVLILALFLSGCSRKHYPDGNIRSIEGVYYGTVVDATDVIVEEDPSLVGPVLGGIAGGFLGSAFGAGTGRTLLIIGGAVAGAELGGGLEPKMRRYRAVQITLELDSGKHLMVVQRQDEYFVRGDRVRIMHMDEGRVRLMHV